MLKPNYCWTVGKHLEIGVDFQQWLLGANWYQEDFYRAYRIANLFVGPIRFGYKKSYEELVNRA